MLYSYNKLSRENNVIKRIIRKRKCIYSAYWKKKSSYKWIHAGQTRIVPGSAIGESKKAEQSKYSSFPFFLPGPHET